MKLKPVFPENIPVSSQLIFTRFTDLVWLFACV